MKIKKDWWLVNGLTYIIIGVLFIISRAGIGKFLEGLLIGGINVLIGTALLQRSKIAFRIIFVLSIYGLLTGLITLSKQSTNYWPALINGIVFAFVLMLWQQIKKEGKKK